MDINELRQKRARLIKQARDLVDLADREKRAFTQEEENQYNGLWAEIERLASQIEREEKLQSEERALAEPANAAVRPEVTPPAANGRSQAQVEAETRAWGRFVRFQALTDADRRALQADLDDAGGNLVPPQQFVNSLLRAIDNQVYIRQWANVMTLTASASLGMPSLDADPDDADWTSELATGNEDSSMAFGKRELSPKPLAKRIKVSRKLLRLSPATEQLVIDRLGYKFGVSQEKAFMTGSGANQPLGIFTASDLGISTDRDVATDNTATAPTFDGLINAKYALKPAYWPRARWLMHRDVVKVIAKIKDGEGIYIWRESVRAGEPDTLLNQPLFMSEYAPNTLTANLYVGILGDFRAGYAIVDSLAMEVQRLGELYSESNQVGFIGRMECDGMPVLEEAFVRVKLGA